MSVTLTKKCYQCKIRASIKKICIYFGKVMLIMFESVVVGLYNHHGFILKIVRRRQGRQGRHSFAVPLFIIILKRFYEFSPPGKIF